MKSYKDIKTDFSMSICKLCKKKLLNNSSPWSLCYDPQYKINIWGGDTHEYRGILCQECAEKLLS